MEKFITESEIDELINSAKSKEVSFIDSLIPNGELIQLKQFEVKPLREKLAQQCSFICPICKKERLKENAVLEHSHKKIVKGTGLIRGVVCSSCNILIGKVENNCKRYNVSLEELPSVLINMAKWLSKKHLPYIHPSEKPKAKILKKSSYNMLEKVCKEKLPLYKSKQKLTKPLESLFLKYNIEPQFY